MKLPPDADTDADADSSSADVTNSNQQDVDFSDYMWMGEEMEEFDSKVLCLYYAYYIHSFCLNSNLNDKL